MLQNNLLETKTLVNTTEVDVRFSEVDSLRVVWHGNYLLYFELGREAFGKQYDLEYLQVYDKGYVVPLVKTMVEHKSPLMYGDTAIIETTLIDNPAAKMVFKYRIFCKSTGKLAATGETIQVFVDNDGDLCITMPPFFTAWKKQQGLL